LSASYRYGPPGEVRKLGTPGADFCDEAPELYWYWTPLPLSASMWGLRAFRFGWLTTCCGAVVVVTGEPGGVGTAPVIVVVVDGAVVEVVTGNVVEDAEVLVDVVVAGLVVVVDGVGGTVVVVVGPAAPEASRVGRVRLQTVAMPTTTRRVSRIARRERGPLRPGSVGSLPPQDRLIRTGLAPLSCLRSLTPSRLTVAIIDFAVQEGVGRVDAERERGAKSTSPRTSA